MSLKSQVTSLDLSKKLKELGVKQKSLFYWYIAENWNKVYFPHEYNHILNYDLKHDKYSAFTASELLELLPDKVILNNEPFFLYIQKTHFNYVISYNDLTVLPIYEEDIDISNACAKILIYLIENKLMGESEPSRGIGI